MAKEIILIVGGVKYVEATLVLQILLLSFLFSLVGGSFLGNVVLLPSGNEKQFMIICCISTVVNVIANAFLIPRWGAYDSIFFFINYAYVDCISGQAD